MADEEIVIKVRQEASGNALSETQQKIEQLKAKLAEMRALEKTYTEKGLPTAAASVRTEQIPYARELRDLQREERTHQSQLARSEKERHAAAKAEVRERLTAERAAATVTGGGGGGGRSGLSTIGGLLGIPTGPAAIALIATTVIHKALGDAIAKMDSVAAQQGELGRTRNRLGKIAGLDDRVRAESLAGGESQSIRDQLEAAEAAKGNFKMEGLMDRVWTGANNIFGTSFETSADRKERENNDLIAQLKKAQPEANAAAEKAFRGGTGGMELERRKAVLDGHQKEAWSIQYKIGLEKEYSRVLNATGQNAALAMEAAELQGKEQIRNRQMAIGAALVNARSGGRDIARAASFAGRQDAILGEVLATMRTQHAEAIGAAKEKKFGGKPYYPGGA